MIRLFVFGAALLTLLDLVHVHTHTLAYFHPLVFGSTWWVPIQFGVAASVGGLVYARAWDRLGLPAALPSRKTLGLGIASFALMYLASGLLPASALTKLIVIVVGAVVIHRELVGSPRGLLLTLAGAVAGPVVEAIHPGFHYLDPDFLGVPVWLPALYACAAPAFGQLARVILSAPSRAAPAS